jgi:hypothetical protein
MVIRTHFKSKQRTSPKSSENENKRKMPEKEIKMVLWKEQFGKDDTQKIEYGRKLRMIYAKTEIKRLGCQA